MTFRATLSITRFIYLFCHCHLQILNSLSLVHLLCWNCAHLQRWHRLLASFPGSRQWQHEVGGLPHICSNRFNSLVFLVKLSSAIALAAPFIFLIQWHSNELRYLSYYTTYDYYIFAWYEQISAEVYWRQPFLALGSTSHLIEYMVMDMDLVRDAKGAPIKRGKVHIYPMMICIMHYVTDDHVDYLNGHVIIIFDALYCDRHLSLRRNIYKIANYVCVSSHNLFWIVVACPCGYCCGSRPRCRR